MPEAASSGRAVVRIRQPVLPWAAQVPAIEGLSLDLRPGLHLVCGGEGRGKTTLLRLLAGELTPSGGQLERQVDSVAWSDPLDSALDGQLAQTWLAQAEARHARWQAGLAKELQAAWALEPHLGKQMHMLSAGTRRKLGLLEAAASGAALILLDTPFAALDGASRRVLLELLEDAASQPSPPSQIWVLADYAAPAGLDESMFASRMDLGD